jgi:hypothetical protein
LFPVDPCKTEMVAGPCRGSFQRYYYDQATKKCKLFYWGGCQPNANNFLTLAECEEQCPSKNGE